MARSMSSPICYMGVMSVEPLTMLLLQLEFCMSFNFLTHFTLLEISLSEHYDQKNQMKLFPLWRKRLHPLWPASRVNCPTSLLRSTAHPSPHHVLVPARLHLLDRLLSMLVSSQTTFSAALAPTCPLRPQPGVFQEFLKCGLTWGSVHLTGVGRLGVPCPY